MLVYRLCDKKELKNIMISKDLKNIGRYGFEYKDKNENDFKYLDNIKYVHFFKDKSNVSLLNRNDAVICTYNIDDEILNRFKCNGFYGIYTEKGKINLTINEYAIPNNLVKYENLELVEISQNQLLKGNVISNGQMDNNLEKIYVLKKQ